MGNYTAYPADVRFAFSFSKPAEAARDVVPMAHSHHSRPENRRYRSTHGVFFYFFCSGRNRNLPVEFAGITTATPERRCPCDCHIQCWSGVDAQPGIRCLLFSSYYCVRLRNCFRTASILYTLIIDHFIHVFPFFLLMLLVCCLSDAHRKRTTRCGAAGEGRRKF